MSLTRTRLTALAAVLAASALALAGCAGSAGGTATTAAAGGSDGAFPVTFTSIYGTTTLDAAPTKVATWGWGATDAVLALGVLPVAIPSDDYSGGDDRIAPWNADAIDALGGDTPTILDSSSYALDVEALLATGADVLIAPYSGLTQDEYDAVTAAGIPVIAPETAVWSTPWRDVITDTGKALGLETEAAGIITGIEQQFADAAAANPDFAGTSIVFATGVDPVYVYLPADPRVEILEDLGFTTPSVVTELDTGEATFYTTVSQENLDQLDAQVVMTYAADDAELQTFLTSSATQLIPAVKSGAVASITGVEKVAAITPTALTVPYILPDLVATLQQAVAKAKA